MTLAQDPWLSLVVEDISGPYEAPSYGTPLWIWPQWVTLAMLDQFCGYNDSWSRFLVESDGWGYLWLLLGVEGHHCIAWASHRPLWMTTVGHAWGWTGHRCCGYNHSSSRSLVESVLGHHRMIGLSGWPQCTMGFHITFQEMEHFVFKLILWLQFSSKIVETFFTW